ncbi:MAG: hypothetical protein J5497_00715, partial [Selenomonadaceae bacterium]|nr:hypothetical protein [Selenomonadaceae bacterium]
FTGSAEFPRAIYDLISDSKLKDVCDELNFKTADFSEDDFLSVYLTNYFRYARKIAADERRQDRD